MRLKQASNATTAADRRVLRFTTRILPWLLGAVMLAVYVLTLNRWVSADSIGLVANVEGLTPNAGLTAPVTFLLTYPFGWLPPAWIPLGLNLFTAGCAALSVGLLARSVALMPHDLAQKKERRRRNAPLKLVALRGAWAAPVLAALACGLQLSFWQGAITATGDMLNLLMFAFVILSLLEFNASRRDAWLLGGALVFGLAVANDWAMAAFIPAFFVALIWLKRIFVFNERFLKRLIKRPHSFRRHLLWQIPGCFLLGLSLFLLMPAVASFSAAEPLGFGTALHHALHLYKASLTHFPRHLLVTSCLISVMPVCVIGLRFYQFVAGSNRLNFLIGTVCFHAAYTFFLLVCLWTMFDSPISPRRLGLGAANLPLYFLGALSIGYFTGHFVLISEVPPEPARKRRRRSSPEANRRRLAARLLAGARYTALGGAVALAIGIPAALAIKNLPEITVRRSDPCGDYINQVAQALPPEGAVLIGSDQFRLAYLESALMRDHRQTGCLLLNLEGLAQSPDYLGFVKHLNPGFNLDFNLPDAGSAANRKVLAAALLQEFCKTHEIYCLSPAPVDNALAEFFYFQPHGLIYQLKRFGVDQAFAEPTPPEVFRDNETFWRNFEARQLPKLTQRINPPQPGPNLRLSQRFLNTVRYWPEADRDSVLAGSFYAAALNDWGVQLQKAGKFPAAGRYFAEALALDAHNAAAQINQKFNADYLANRTETMERPLETALSLNQYRDWQHVARDGAVDEPNFCYMLGAFMADNHLLRPAIAQFERVKELSPARLDTYVSLARLFEESHDYTNALHATDDILALSPTNEAGLVLKSTAYIQLSAFRRAIPLLDQLLAANPHDGMALLNRGIAYQHDGQFGAARRDLNMVIQIATNAYPAYYDLAEMADQEKDKAAAITNYELFLKYAPPGAPEVAGAEARLKALQPPAP